MVLDRPPCGRILPCATSDQLDHRPGLAIEGGERSGLTHGFTHFGFKLPWSAWRVLDTVRNNAVLTANLNWHYHEGNAPWSPECLAWEEHCRRLAPLASRMRILATLSGWGDTPIERRACQIGDLGDLRGIWEEGESP